MFSLIKHKRKLADKPPVLTSCNSAWSYSYDLILNHLCEEALRKTIKSDCSETEVEHKSISKFDFAEDLENEFIFQGSGHVREVDAIDRLSASVTETLNSNGLEDTQKHRTCKSGSNVESAVLNKTEQYIDNLKSLLLPDAHGQQSWLPTMSWPFPNDMGNSDGTKHSSKEKIAQIQTTIIHYIEQLIHKTVQPLFLKLEDLQMEYERETMKWKTQIDFMEQRNSLLKSELQDVKRAYREIAEELANLKTFYCKNQSVVERNFAMDSQVSSAVSEKPTLSKHKYTAEKEDTDVKSACYRTNHPEMERNLAVNENNISEKKYLKFKKILDKQKLSLERTVIQKLLPSKMILQDSKNTLIPDDSKKLKLGNTDFLKKLDMKSRSLNEDLSLCEKLKAVNPLMIKSPGEKHPLPKKTNCTSNENNCRENCVCLFKEHKSDWRRTALGNDRKSNPSTEKSSGVSLKMSRLKPSSQQLKEKLSLKSELHDPNALTFDYSWKLREPEKPSNSLNERVLKDDKKKVLLPFQKISQESYLRCLKNFGEREGSSKRLKRSLTGITIRAAWL